MITLLASNNDNNEPIKLELDVEWDNGPYLSVAIATPGGTTLLDLSIPDMGAWNHAQTKIAEKLLELLDIHRRGR